ncbi:hypothetical protein Vretimale_14285 [Volvox reticuliferus]|nr:hypothetical protein Vretifemale_15288 [Volvox reticuliferus]GIM10709.1 hypothetical protein Vretimale_14285 [Volvox reticuliferus]
MAVDRLASGDYVKWLLRIRSRLDAMLAVLAVCSGRACSHPFQVLHTDGRVSDLWAAMDEQYDSMYDAIPPFSFSRCLPYQDLENERSMFRGAVVPDCTGEGAALGAPGRELADVGPHAGSRKSDGSSSSTAGDINCGSSTSGSDGDRSGRSTADGATFVMVESQIESAAVPLPAKYRLVTDVYGNSAARDSILLA